MLIFASLIPVSHLVFIKSEKLKQYLSAASSVLAFALLVITILDKKDYLIGLPSVVLLLIYANIKINERQFNSVEFIGVLFGAAAMVTTKNHEVIGLGIAMDLLFSLSQKNPKKYFLNMITWTPLLLGYVFATKTEYFDFFLAGTILLRAFDWPLRILPEENSPKAQEFLTKIVISVALWKTTEMLSPGFWMAFWMLVPLFFSWGGGERNVLLLTSLSLWSISPIFGLYSVVLWALYFIEGKWIFSLIAMIGCAGLVANNNVSGLSQEVLFTLAVLQSLAISRAEVILIGERSNQKRSQSAAFFLIAIASFATIYLATTPFEIRLLDQGNMFIAMNIVFVVAGMILVSKKKKGFFQRLPGFNVIEYALNKIESSKMYNKKQASKTELYDFSVMKKVFLFMDTDAYLITLMAIVAAIMFWGVL